MPLVLTQKDVCPTVKVMTRLESYCFWLCSMAPQSVPTPKGTQCQNSEQVNKIFNNINHGSFISNSRIKLISLDTDSNKQKISFLTSLFKLYSETILRGLEVIPGFVIGERNLNNIYYVDETVLIADSERTLT